MRPTDLHDTAGTLLAEAAASPARRAGRTLDTAGREEFRQTVLALLQGESMNEHESPSTATLQVLEGKVRFRVDDANVDLPAGALLPIPPRRHAVDAIYDSVMLLTVAHAEGR